MRILLLFVCLALANCHEVRTVYSWNNVEYDFPITVNPDALTSDGEYIPENNVPLGMEIWEDKIFITVPRWKNGVASNLNYISKNDTSGIIITSLLNVIDSNSSNFYDRYSLAFAFQQNLRN